MFLVVVGGDAVLAAELLHGAAVLGVNHILRAEDQPGESDMSGEELADTEQSRARRLGCNDESIKSDDKKRR